MKVTEKDILIKELKRSEKELKSQLKKREDEIVKGTSDLKKLNKKYREYKKYVKTVEDTILQKDEKLRQLELF